MANRGLHRPEMEEPRDGVERLLEVEAGDDETHEVEKGLLPRQLVTKTIMSKVPMHNLPISH